MAANSLGQCRICKKPFYSFGARVCGDCQDRIEEDFKTIKDFLYDNPQKTSAEAIAEGTGVDKRIILHLIQDRRLLTKDTPDITMSCEICKKPSADGRICNDCKAALSQDLNKIARKPKDREAPEKKGPSKMHIDIRKMQ